MKVPFIFCITILFFCNGCGDQHLPLIKVAGQKNTFELKGFLWGQIDDVVVSKMSDPNDDRPNPEWCIKNISSSNGSGFHVTVPEVPEGFVQIFPEPPRQFQLIDGQLYRITVSYTSGSASGCYWIAEK